VDSFDTLMNTYQQIGDVLPLLEKYQALFRCNSEMKKILALMYLDILEFHKRAIRFFSGRGMDLHPINVATHYASLVYQDHE
jgi:hypothetical protein